MISHDEQYAKELNIINKALEYFETNFPYESGFPITILICRHDEIERVAISALGESLTNMGFDIADAMKTISYILTNAPEEIKNEIFSRISEKLNREKPRKEGTINEY